MVLVDNQVLKLDNVAGASIACERGTLWITQHGDGRDLVLAAGKTFTVERGGLTVITAMAARTVVRIASPLPRRKSWLQFLFPAFGRV